MPVLRYKKKYYYLCCSRWSLSGLPFWFATAAGRTRWLYSNCTAEFCLIQNSPLEAVTLTRLFAPKSIHIS